MHTPCRKELYCEFCDSQLPDWKAALTPTCGAAAPAVMNVNFDGRTYSFEVKPGPEGYKLFTESIRRAFNLPGDSELNITFTCDEPTVPEVGSLLTLQGPGAYDAAVHCASVSAARRMTSPPLSRSISGADSSCRGFDGDEGAGAGGGTAAAYSTGTGTGAMPTTPRSAIVGGGHLSRAPSFNTPSPFDSAALPSSTGHTPMSVTPMPGAGEEAGPSSATTPSRNTHTPNRRRLSGLGRKIRSALTDLLSAR